MARRANGTFERGASGNPSGKSRNDSAEVKAATQQRRFDGWFNFTTGHGVGGMDKREGTGFYSQVMSFEQLAELWRGDDLAARAVETLPKEALRQGYDLIIPENDDEDSDAADGDESDRVGEIMDRLEVLGADQIIRTALGYERGLGGGAVLIGANDRQTDLTKPLDFNKIVSLDWLTPLEARELYPVYGYADPRQPKYGQPEIYRLTSRAVLPPYGGQYAETVMDIHESRLLVFPGVRVSRYQSMAAQGGWGDSVLIRMWRVLRDFNLAWSSAGGLVTDFARGVYKFKDLVENIGTDAGYNETMARLRFMELAASTINGTVIDAADDFTRQATPVAGLADLLNQFATRLAAAAEQPLTLLFGTSPAGLNATGESDIRLFYDRVASYQKEKLLPHLKTLVKILFLTTGSKREPEKWSIRFKPLWQESAKDRASAQLTTAQADHIWITDGVVSAEEVADSHWGTGEWNPDINIDFDARQKQEMATHSPVGASDLDAMGRPVNPNFHPGDPTNPNSPHYEPPPPPGSAPGPGPGDTTGGQDMGTSPQDADKAAAPDPSTPPTSNVQNDDSEDPDPWGNDTRTDDPDDGDLDEATLRRIIKLAQAKLGKTKKPAKPIPAPPPPGSAAPSPPVTPPGPPAAPDPNTAPQPFVQAYDGTTGSVLANTLRADDWDESKHPRAHDGKFGEGDGKWHREGIDRHETETFGHEEIEHAHGAVHPVWNETRGVGKGAPNGWQAEAHGTSLGSFEKKGQAKAAVVGAARARAAAEKLQPEVDRSKERGGNTFDPKTLGHPDKGYSVAVYPDRTVKIEGKDGIDAKKLSDFVAKNHDIIANDKQAHVGTWYNANNDTWYLDIPHVEPHLATAASLGRDRGELAIYDLKRGEDIEAKDYDDAIQGKGRFTGRTDAAAEPRAGSAVRSTDDHAGADGRGDEAARGQGAEGSRSAGEARGRGTARADQARILTGVVRWDDIQDDVDGQLRGDYDRASREWLRHVSWTGPERVALDRIDYSNKDSWRAAKEPDRVKKFRKRIQGGWEKPIILVDRPGFDKLMVVDGHHRSLAYFDAGKPVLAYIAHVDRPNGPWDEFHSEQREKRNDGVFVATEHPRGAGGRFGSGGGGLPSPAAAAQSHEEQHAAEHTPLAAAPVRAGQEQAPLKVGPAAVSAEASYGKGEKAATLNLTFGADPGDDRGDWDESQHPRATDGKFGEGGSTESKAEVGHAKSLPIQFVKPSDDERKAIDSWTGNGYRRINEALRKGTEVPEAKALDSVINKSTVEKPMTVFRGINSEAVAGLKTGSIFIDRGYASTTTEHDIADSFAVNGSAYGDKHPDAGAVVRIVIPAGAHAMPVYDAMGWGVNPEHEVLLPRGSRFEVTRVREEEVGGENTGEAPETSYKAHGRRTVVEAKLL